jgi:hypothetical protein
MIEALVRRARLRYIANELLAQGAYAASAGMAGVVLVLITGTQLLDWRFLLAISTATLALGAYRTLRRVPSLYFIAQLVDRRLLLADTLSTAFFFAGGKKHALEPMREGQRQQAERAAAGANIERAVPFSMPRAVYALAILGLVASSLFALRYGVSRTLDLRAPLARILMENFGVAPDEKEATLRKDPRTPKPDAPKPIGLTLPEGDPNSPQQLDPAPDSALDTVGIPSAVNDPLSQNQKNGKAKTESAVTEKADGDQADSDSADGSDASGDGLKDGPEGAKRGNQSGAPTDGQPSQANSDQNASLMAKLRDAMSNLLSKMRQQSGSNSQQASSAGQNAQKAGSQRSGQRQNGNSAEGQQQQAGAQQTADADRQMDGEGKDGQNAQAKGGGHSADQQAANQPGSGIGRQDGNKDTKLAEQLAAMGKISEIIGKRSANVTGEITVEVPSSQQRLQTPYSQTNVTHTDAGGDISRDEVPVIFQQYVQQYFEQLRKQPPIRKGETSTRSKAQTPATKTQPPTM